MYVMMLCPVADVEGMRIGRYDTMLYMLCLYCISYHVAVQCMHVDETLNSDRSLVHHLISSPHLGSITVLGRNGRHSRRSILY